jgi:hypothetical protein
MPIHERATSTNSGTVQKSAIPAITIKVPIPQNTQAPAQAAVSTQSGKKK